MVVVVLALLSSDLMVVCGLFTADLMAVRGVLSSDQIVVLELLPGDLMISSYTTTGAGASPIRPDNSAGFFTCLSRSDITTEGTLFGETAL